MSASREKHARKDSVLTMNTQDTRKAKEANQDRNFYIKCAVAVIALAVAFVLCFLYNSEGFRKNMTAATVNGEKFTATDVDFYYNYAVNQYSSYLSYFGVDVNQDLDLQTYSDDMSWGDYFRQEAVTLLSETASMYQEAMANGYELSESAQASLDEYSASIDEYCKTNGMTREDYMHYYGSAMTEEIFMKHLTMMAAASDYANQYQNTKEYTDEELQAYYDEHKNDIDLASYEVLTFKADYTDIAGTSEGSTDESVTYSEEDDAQAMEAAKNNANAVLDRVNSGEKLADIAEEVGTNYYSNKTDVSYSSFTGYSYNEWVFNDSRVKGEASMMIDESNNCWYVVVFHDRYQPDYATVDVRHILVTPADSGLSEGDEGYEEAEELNDAYAANQAQEILDQYLAGERTAEAFGALANERSSDSDGTDGGLYTRVYKGQMVDEFEDWCFDASRKVGDTGIVKSPYGYHVMYFQGENVPYWQARCINALFTEWQNAIYDNANTSTSSFGLKAVG